MGYIIRKHWFLYFVMTDKNITAIKYSDVFNALIQFVKDKREFEYVVDMLKEIVEDENIIKDILKDFVKDVFKLKETFKKQSLSKALLRILEAYPFEQVYTRVKQGNKYIYLVDDVYKLYREIKNKIKEFELEDVAITYSEFLQVVDIEYDYDFKKYRVIIKDYSDEVDKIFKLLRQIEEYFKEKQKKKQELKEPSY